jgi:carboxyl-terminal processing protease
MGEMLHAVPRLNPLLLAKKLVLLPALSLLISCGGGGGSAGPSGSSGLTAASLAQQCVAPRAGSTDRAGSIDTEKSWVRAHMDETYLWYRDIPAVNPANFTLAAYGDSAYATLNHYFEALKTPNTTASGKRVDEFSYTMPTAERLNQQSGIASGYGISFTFIQNTPPRLLRVLYVEPGSPAALAGVLRGDTVTSMDGIDINDSTPAGINLLNAGLFPTLASKTTLFGLQTPGSGATRQIGITSSPAITVYPLALTKVIPDGTSTIGYLALNSFNIVSAEKQLFDAVTTLKAAKVNELVVDLRYNGGGFLDIANQLGWMIGGASLAGKTFEKTSCNDKKPFGGLCDGADAFQQTSRGFAPALLAPDQPLPQLGLQRVFVLTSGDTCSASESVVNGLSPFMQVIRIGSTTCGKPYGFYYADNCGTTYAAMQFKGVNHVGFGDYADGFAPTCPVADDLSKQRGDPAELMLAGALTYMRTGACPPASTGIQKPRLTNPLHGNFPVLRSQLEEVRVLGRPSRTP